MAEIPRGRSATKENVYEPGIGREIMNFFIKFPMRLFYSSFFRKTNGELLCLVTVSSCPRHSQP